MSQLPAVPETELVYVVAPPLDRHPAAVYLARLAPGGRRAALHRLKVAAGFFAGVPPRELAWERLRYQHFAALQAWMASNHSASYTNHVVASCRGALKEAWRLELLTAEEFHRATDLAPVKGKRLPAGRLIDVGELAALFESCAEDTDRARGAYDAALLAVLYGAGIRRGELRGLRAGDYDAEQGTLRVIGKGNREDLVFLSSGARDALDEYISVRQLETHAALFRKADIDAAPRDEKFWRRVKRRARRAAVRPFSLHDLRRSFVTHLLDRGGDVLVVQRLARHSQTETTARYDRRGEDAERRVAELLPVPFRSTRR